MEDESVSLIKYVPSFARGFNLLLVHDDTLTLAYLSSLLELYSFKVTAIHDTSTVASMICDHEGKFKLIMAKANMPGMNAFSFLDVVLEKDIPVIFIYSGGFDDVPRKALATGLCYFLEEPIRSNDLKYVWQHLYHTQAYSFKETQNANLKDQGKVCHAKGLQHTEIKQVLGTNGRRNHNDEEDKLEEKRTDDNQTMPGSLIMTQSQVHRENGKRNHDDNGCMLKEKKTIDNQIMPGSWSLEPMDFYNYYIHVFAGKKRSIVWTPELHSKFTEAIRVLGENDARPKQILSRMNEPYLTIRQVASHLQKHRLLLKRAENASNFDLSPTSTLSNEAQVPSPSEVSSLGTKGLPMPIASLNKSQNQNQFLMNNTETEEANIVKLLEASGNPTFQTELTNGGSQNLDSSMDQNQHATKYDDLIKMLVEEDCDSFDLFENGTDHGDVDQYCEMLKTVLDGDSSSPSEFDMDNPNRS